MQHLLARAAENYLPAKRQAEAGVTSWGWATSSWYDPRPLFLERSGRAPGRRLRTEPERPHSAAYCGVDDLGRLLVERQFNSVGCYERFFSWSGPSTVATLYDYHGTEKAPINVIVLDSKDGRIVSAEFIASRGYMHETYTWDGDTIAEVVVNHAEIQDGAVGEIKPHVVARAQYSAAGVLACVFVKYPEFAEHEERVVFERVGGRIKRRHA